MRTRLTAAVVVVLVIAVAAVALGRSYRPAAVRASNAVGDAACLSCHRQESSFETTAHRLTSRRASRAAIDGSFATGQNILETANPRLHFRMDSTASGFYETAVTGPRADTTTRAERIDIVTGSARKGQSYLYWRGDQLLQLPVSYWRGIGWINSPGYRDGVVNFDRPILPRCLECHASGLESVPDTNVSNRYRLTTALLGVSCETCHGAGGSHVTRERSILRTAPVALVSTRIVNPARLSRARQIDQCALCHGGLQTPIAPAFSYVPGEDLDKHLTVPFGPAAPELDVHGNQVALLERSACFRGSQMTCATCHDVHQTQRDTVALSGRCLSCHKVQSCGLYPQQGNTLVGRCVDCHMPKLPSNTIVSSFGGNPVHPLVRTHWIKAYPRESAR